MENKEIYGYIYLITNLLNNKQYIGQTTGSIKKRFNKHCNETKNTVMNKAIRKYGKENFIIQELAVAYNQEELTFLEGMYISWFNTLTTNGFGYNVTNIINGKGKHSKETIEKMRIAQRKPESFKQNSKNGKSRRGKRVDGSSSQYCGVIVCGNKFKAQISFNKNIINLGHYDLEEDAAKAYDIKSLELFGYDCVLNFPNLREDYINRKILVKKNKSKSGIKNIYFEKQVNKWQFRWLDKNLNRKKSKNFKKLEDAILYKTKIFNGEIDADFISS